ncbi:alpha-(1,3)-fucosyltransferase 10 [Galleria mellonella]|uniref:Fucosyltransferase n=1 Tax=Galleria mellonella TaxID=7137 RepID=A0A6J1WNB2_GALME|nr:alpha-(1,3)-fucosyltransferase 10 [Galleria mellonella]
MCTKSMKRNTHCFCRQIVIYLKEMTMKIFKRIMKLTVRNCLCSCIFIIFFLIFISFWKSESIGVYKQNAHIPVIVWWTNGFPSVNQIRTCSDNIDCEIIADKKINGNAVDAYLFYGSVINLEDLPLPRRPYDVIWGLFHEESPRNVEELMHEEMLNLFNFSATFSRHSDVPFPLQYMDSINDITSKEHYVDTSTKNNYLKEIGPIMYLQTDCETSTERDKYVKELMKFIQVDSYGACLNNKVIPQKFKHDYLNNLNDPEFLDFTARYKFVIAIENGVCDDYITEKFWRAIKVGTVPIYFGSPTIRDWLPNNKSAILIKDFPTPKAMSEYLQLLLKNDKLYEEYLEHKIKGTITNKRLHKELRARPYQNDALKTAETLECLVCKKLHEKNKRDKNIVTKYHYNCPQPISALTLGVNPHNSWLFSWRSAKLKVQEIYKKLG